MNNYVVDVTYGQLRVHIEGPDPAWVSAQAEQLIKDLPVMAQTESDRLALVSRYYAQDEQDQ